MQGDYKADVTPSDCWARLKETPNAFMVDVRTRPEWTFVGIARLDEAGKQPILAEWQVYPTMSIDPNFVSLTAEAIDRAGGDRDAEIYFLCRSGQRSASAAALMTASGYANCFNISGGFEGPPDAEGHRGKSAGWKAEGLPWQQG
ncbi:rhodanese-like domain-containing protein [Fulvimarina sp. 2208YS6-2-32]|uniref:Rhodanese-like domain-containing protein n=1 Tax=Fulvimarina uroteuthidis TaxID=3098149 RepID=A0ABU5I2Q3_9HYPH|nr:rhodanese-like domain-containing protein [Fulvimarina sp. 2208YS6-2-32]MDY8109650.1 rhodanese-like domain-containing protein [Fulvimarina sp. 2208YS6-2-32]